MPKPPESTVQRTFSYSLIVICYWKTQIKLEPTKFLPNADPG